MQFATKKDLLEVGLLGVAILLKVEEILPSSQGTVVTFRQFLPVGIGGFGYRLPYILS